MSKQIRICIEENNIIYKITSIYLLNDGSFKFDVPYCPYDEALVFKHPIKYKPGTSFIKIDSFVQKFKAKNRPQLSIHSSGFVQFSGNNITSGIDKSGKIKGVGIYTAPLNNPITSGPTLGGSFWGLNKYEVANNLSENDIVIKQDDFIKRIHRDEPIGSLRNTNFNTYLLEIFVFPEKARNSIWTRNKQEVLTFRFNNYYECPGAIFTFPIIKLINHGSILGIVPFLNNTEFPNKNEFGFNIGGPSGLNKPGQGTKLYMIQLFYPNFLPEIKEYIDYVKK